MSRWMRFSLVGAVGGVRHHDHDAQQLFQPEVLAGVLERGAAHQLHGDARRPVVGIHVINSTYVWDVQARMQLGLVHEADHGRGFEVLEDLQGHRPGQDGVPGFVHVAHGAVAQERADDVAPLLATLRLEPGRLGKGFGHGGNPGRRSIPGGMKTRPESNA